VRAAGYAGRVSRRLRTVAVVTALLAACPAGGCTAAAGGLPGGLTATLVQLRSDVADRQMQVRVRNGGDATVTIGEVRVDDPRFSPAAARVLERTTDLPPGSAVDIRVALGEAVCDTDADAAPTLTLDLVGDAPVAAPVDELFPFLQPLHDADCLRERIADAATLAIAGFTASAAGEPAELLLELTGTGPDAGAFTLAGVRDTNLLDVDDGALGRILPVRAEAGTRRLAVPLVPARCDPHAVQEDKRGTVFAVDVELDGEPGSFDLAAEPDLRARMLSWVAD